MHPGYFPVLFWSLLIFASFWGYGELLRRRINRPEFADIGWGLTAAWGMAVVLAIGGVLMMLHLAKAPNLTVVVLFRVAATLYYTAQSLTISRRTGARPNDLWLKLSILPRLRHAPRPGFFPARSSPLPALLAQSSQQLHRV